MIPILHARHFLGRGPRFILYSFNPRRVSFLSPFKHQWGSYSVHGSPSRLPPETWLAAALVSGFTLACWSAKCHVHGSFVLGLHPISRCTHHVFDASTLSPVASVRFRRPKHSPCFLHRTIAFTDAICRSTSASQNFMLRILLLEHAQISHLPPPGWHFR